MSGAGNVMGEMSYVSRKRSAVWHGSLVITKTMKSVYLCGFIYSCP